MHIATCIYKASFGGGGALGVKSWQLWMSLTHPSPRTSTPPSPTIRKQCYSIRTSNPSSISGRFQIAIHCGELMAECPWSCWNTLLRASGRCCESASYTLRRQSIHMRPQLLWVGLRLSWHLSAEHWWAHPSLVIRLLVSLFAFEFSLLRQLPNTCNSGPRCLHLCHLLNQAMAGYSHTLEKAIHFCNDTRNQPLGFFAAVRAVCDESHLQQLIEHFRAILGQTAETWISTGNLKKIIRACINEQYEKSDIEFEFYHHRGIQAIIALFLAYTYSTDLIVTSPTALSLLCPRHPTHLDALVPPKTWLYLVRWLPLPLYCVKNPSFVVVNTPCPR